MQKFTKWFRHRNLRCPIRSLRAVAFLVYTQRESRESQPLRTPTVVTGMQYNFYLGFIALAILIVGGFVSRFLTGCVLATHTFRSHCHHEPERK